MRAIPWTSEIIAPLKRTLDLKDFRARDGGLRIEIEEESGRSWSLHFNPVQAWRVTSEECAGSVFAELPAHGSMFLMLESDWLKYLGDSRPLLQSKHFVVCCYDEVIEVLAWGCFVSPVIK